MRHMSSRTLVSIHWPKLREWKGRGEERDTLHRREKEGMKKGEERSEGWREREGMKEGEERSEGWREREGMKEGEERSEGWREREGGKERREGGMEGRKY